MLLADRAIGSQVADRAAAPDRRAWTRDVDAVLVFLLITVIVVWRYSTADAWLRRTDVLAFYVPFSHELGAHIRGFDLPGWAPYQAAGLPLAGDPQSGWMYLPAMLVYTAFAPETAAKALIGVHLLILGLSTYAFARVLGMRSLASLFAAISVSFGATVYQNTYCCTIWSQVSPWVPLGLLGVELGARRRAWQYRAAGWAISGFAISQMFAGWIGQGVYNGLLIIGAYTVYRAIVSPPGAASAWAERLRALVVSGTVILTLGLGLSAAGVLPRLDANRASQLAGGDYDEVTEEQADRGWQPEFLGWLLLDTDSDETQAGVTREPSRRLYVGAVTVALAVGVLFAAGGRYAAPFFVSVVALILVLTTKESVVHQLFYRLPRYESLQSHAPFRVYGLFFVFPALLAAATLDTLGTWARQRRGWVIALLPVPLLYGVDRFIETRTRQLSDTVWAAAGATSLLLVAACVLARQEMRLGPLRTERMLTGIQVLALVALLWEPTARQLITPAQRPDRPEPAVERVIDASISETDPGGAGEFLQTHLAASVEPFRYFGYDGAGLRTETQPGLTYHGRVLDPGISALLVSARATMLGLYDIQGYNPSQSARYLDYLAVLNGGIRQDYHDANVLSSGITSPLIDLLNVRYIVVPADVPPGRPDLLRLSQTHRTVFNNGTVRVIENANALPHAWLVHAVETVAGGSDQVIARLASGEVDPRTTAVSRRAIPGVQTATSGAADRVAFVRYDANRITIDVETATSSLLVISEHVAAGWNAYVDGERVDRHRVDYLLTGVVVPAGSSTVELRYEPAAMRYGLIITGSSLIAVLGIAVCGLAAWRRSRSGRGDARAPSRGNVAS